MNKEINQETNEIDALVAEAEEIMAQLNPKMRKEAITFLKILATGA